MKLLINLKENTSHSVQLNSAKTRFLFNLVLSDGVDEEEVDEIGVSVTLYRLATKVSHPRRKALSMA
jgi:hypothetical protein